MTPEQWAEVRRLFEALCDLPVDEQRQRLEQAPVPEAVRRQVAELLDFDDTTGLDRIAEGVGSLSRSLANEDLRGERVGPWRLDSPLGEGGMGEVYLAERADGRYEARVAIKFLALSGRRARELFERERRILARLQHPAIAHLIDAGEHPRLGAWLAMAYVDGRSLGRLAEAGSLNPRRAVSSMIEAARAVAFAHRNLILHRDLKPDHLMLDRDGQLRILDFGVAALLEEDSGQAALTGRATFTPRYAAPEQILGQPTTTRTDIYALGLVLHELLNGGKGAFGDEAERLTERKLAERRNRLGHLPGLGQRQCRDLDAVLGRCLAVAPEHRYASADELADDLIAVLEDRPVQARRGSWLELTQRWLGRHRLAGAMVVVALVAVVGGSAFSSWFALQAREERNAAIAEAEKARRITDFMEALFASSAPGVDQGPDTTVREMLDRGRERIAGELGAHPEVAAHLQRTVARSYMYLGLYEEALSVLDELLEGESPDSRGQRGLLAARIHNLQGDYQGALDRLTSAELWLRRNNDRAQAAIQRATASVNLGRNEQARSSALVVGGLADNSPEGLELQLSAQNLLGVLAFNEADYAAARLAFEEILALQLRLQGRENEKVALTLNNLGGVAVMMGDLDGALDYYQRALNMLEAHYGVDNQAVAMVLRSLGLTYRRLGQADAAERTLARSVAAYEAFAGRGHHAWREALLQHAELRVLDGRDHDAVELLAKLPPLETSTLAQEQLVLCRLAQLRRVLDLPVPAGLDCGRLEQAPASVRAMHHYLAARLARDRSDAGFSDELARATALVDGLDPPDPLLREALARL